MTSEAERVEEVAKGLTKAQRDRLVDAVRLLNWMAGEGRGVAREDGSYVFADELLYDLANDLMPEWDGDEEYTIAFAHLLAKEGR